MTSAVTTLTVLYLLDVQGSFAASDCRSLDALAAGRVPDFAATVAALDDARAAAGARGEPPPLLLAAGDLLVPSRAAAAFLERPDGPARAAAVLARAGIDEVALGSHDLGAPFIDAFASAARAAGFGLHVDNVRPDGPAAALGGAAAVLRARDGLLVGIVSVIDDERAPPGALDDSARAAAARIAALRTAATPADAVILVVQVRPGTTAAGRVAALAARLSGDARPDLVLASGLGGALGLGAGAIERIHLAGLAAPAPPIVGGPPGAIGAVRLRVERVPGAARALVTAEPLPSPPRDPARFDPALRAVLLEESTAYCVEAGAALGPGRLPAPIGPDTFTTYLLHALRREASAEVALVDAGAVDPTAAFPLTGAISLDDLERALPDAGRAVLGRIRGDELERFLRVRWSLTELPDERGLRIVGVTTTDGRTFRLNGRPIEADVPYRIVTTERVVAGAAGILAGFAGEKWRWKPVRRRGAHLDLVAVMARHLRDRVKPHRRDPGPPPLTVPARFRTLADRVLYDLRLDLYVGFTDISIGSTLAEDVAAAEPQLSRNERSNLVVDFGFSFSAASSEHAFEFISRYAFAWSTTNLGVDPGVVSTDIVTNETSYRMRFFKKALGPERWYVPEPYIANFVETELLAGIDETTGEVIPRGRTVTFTAGWRFRLGTRFELKIGAGAKSSGVGVTLLAPPVAVIELGYRLIRTRLAAPFGAPIHLFAELSLLTGERLGDPNKSETEIRAKTVLEIGLGTNLALAITHNLYVLSLLDIRDVPDRLVSGVASDIIAAIRVDLDFRRFDYD